mgnify:CR=1 FL=1
MELTATRLLKSYVSVFPLLNESSKLLFQLEAIKQTKVDLEVYPGIYTLPDHPEVYIRQRDLILDAIRTYGTEHIGGITVGNEFMLK